MASLDEDSRQMASIKIKHNLEMGHRLSLQPESKCFHLHGHSWYVTLFIYGPMDPTTGMVMEFGEVKRRWRGMLDTEYDHHMLLNSKDPLFNYIMPHVQAVKRWGITTLEDRDPTVENFAAHLYRTAKAMFQRNGMFQFHIELQEAATNAVEYGDRCGW
jgi:6-pyruvoyltetrahydropterin/6-carboxytetrahydropterin synthase